MRQRRVLAPAVRGSRTQLEIELAVKLTKIQKRYRLLEATLEEIAKERMSSVESLITWYGAKHG